MIVFQLWDSQALESILKRSNQLSNTLVTDTLQLLQLYYVFLWLKGARIIYLLNWM